MQIMLDFFKGESLPFQELIDKIILNTKIDNHYEKLIVFDNFPEDWSKI